MKGQDHVTRTLLLFACLSFSMMWATAAAVFATGQEGFTLGTTVTITLKEYDINRAEWYAEYGAYSMPGRVTVSESGQGNQVIITGRRDGTRYPGEPDWVMQQQTVTLQGTATYRDITVPFGPLYSPQGYTEWTQTYKYTARITAGGASVENAKILSVRSYDYGGNGAGSIVIDETL